MNKYWGTWIVFIGVFFHSCKQEVKQNNISFYSVDLLEMEKMKGEEILLSDLIESLEIIKLDTYQGNVSIKGHVDSLGYFETSSLKKEKENSFLTRLFK